MGSFEQVKLEEQTPPRYSHGQSEAQTIQEPPTHASRRKPLEGAHPQELPRMRHLRPRPRRLPKLRLLPRSSGDQQGRWRSLIPFLCFILTPPGLILGGVFSFVFPLEHMRCPHARIECPGTPHPTGRRSHITRAGSILKHHTPSPRGAARGSDHPKWG
jgi:hypothetical protein